LKQILWVDYLVVAIFLALRILLVIFVGYVLYRELKSISKRRRSAEKNKKS